MAKKKKRYVSFYDETFHDRKITEQKKNIGEMNIENIENSDIFLTTNIMFLAHKYPKQAKKFWILKIKLNVYYTWLTT